MAPKIALKPAAKAAIAKAAPKEAKAKVPKVVKKTFKKVGQKYETPDERDSLRIFYTSLLKQNKNSEMAYKWCLERGLLPKAKLADLVLGIVKLKL